MYVRHHRAGSHNNIFFFSDIHITLGDVYIYLYFFYFYIVGLMSEESIGLNEIHFKYLS